jgi:hydrogenase maturation factor
MNKKEQANALKLEIESTIKKWSQDADKIGIDIVSSITLEDTEEDGTFFMQSIMGKASSIVANLCATLERVPRGLKMRYMASIVESMMEVDEEVEMEFATGKTEEK